MAESAEKRYTKEMGRRDPFKCRKCGSQSFKAEVEGTCQAWATVQAPAKASDAVNPKEYDPGRDYEIEDYHDMDVEWDGPSEGSWMCDGCGSTDIISCEEAYDTETAREAAIERGDIYFVHPGHMDMFTGKPVGALVERIAVGV